ncbi:MAG: hypothetical protein ACTHLE_14225 [Agriterribacter sp.]
MLCGSFVLQKQNKMRTLLVGIGAFAMVVTTHFSAFSQEDRRSAQARKELAEAKKNLTKAKIDSSADFEQFKLEAENKIEDNKKRITELRLADADLSADLKKKYDKKITALQEKNNKLQKQIDESANTKTTKWTEFKREFNQDMNKLTDAIKNIGRRNHTE